jgi:glycerol kinase
MQEQADLLNVLIERPSDVETTVRGAAYMAALGSGMIEDVKSLSLKNNLDKSWKANCTSKQRLEKFNRWKRRVKALIEGGY